jgi:outer membrane protein assembly factor BamD (BamD/ComL family)
MKRQRPRGRHWTVLGMAFGAVARAGEPFGQRLWDDPPFTLYQQATEAMDRRDYARADALARSALEHDPDFVLARYLLGQVALAEARWDEAADAFRQVLERYPGSPATREALRVATTRLQPAAAGGRSR